MNEVVFRPEHREPDTQSLVERMRMRSRTRALHAEGERSGIVASLLRGQDSAAACALYLRNLLPAYQAMENVLKAGDKLVLNGVGRPELYRSEAIEADLDDLVGPLWRETVPLPESGWRYSQRIELAAAGDGDRLLAHCYTRYLGDLFGGQIIGRRISTLFGRGSWSLRFAAFPGIQTSADLLTNFALPWTMPHATLANLKRSRLRRKLLFA